MAIQYWQGKGVKNKKRILTVRGGYHGDTFGAMSVCDPDNGMHHMFTGILPEQIFAERPSCRFDEPFDPRSLDDIRDLLYARADEVAAVIIEPIVQGAGGMWFYHPEYLKGLRTLCDRWEVLLICDEIATGFGRTGKMFAMEWAGISPDILCVGKGLTGGYLSFAATITTEKVAQGISMEKGILMHGPTYMGNPLACAVACKNLEILIQSPWQQRVASIESALRQGLEPCRNLPQVEDVRVLGAIGVVQTREEVNPERCRKFFIQQGVWIRPFGHLIYIMPPYTLSDQEVGRLTRAVEKLVEIYIGPQARRISAVIIIIAWTAILAAQFSASARILTSFGDLGFEHALWLGGGLIIAYTALGGQLSVIKSDKWQFLFMILILVCVVVSLVRQDPRAASRIRWELFSPGFFFQPGVIICSSSAAVMWFAPCCSAGFSVQGMRKVRLDPLWVRFPFCCQRRLRLRHSGPGFCGHDFPGSS